MLGKCQLARAPGKPTRLSDASVIAHLSVQPTRFAATMRPMAGSENSRTLTQRLQSGVARRARAFWKRWTRQGPEFPAEAALDWLIGALRDCDPDLRALCRETLLDYGCADVVALWAGDAFSDRLVENVPESFELSGSRMHASSTELAQAVVHWHRQREVERAGAAFCLLEARQTCDGDFPSPPAFFPKESPRDRVMAARSYLDAAQLRVSAAFDTHGQDLPDTIDSSDGRMVAVREWFASLPPNAAVADVGCGSGRFLIRLSEQFFEAKLTGIDPCPALLDRLPPSVGKHPGTLLRTRLADASFDAAFAVESLEHCLVAKRGIAELGRIVRPGGRVLVIDKHRSKQALSECEPWERWFHPHELTGWLELFCDEIRVELISHGEGSGSHGLFLAASGRRR